MKPILRRGLTLGQPEWGWICQTPYEHARGWDRYNERICTWAATPVDAWRRWFEKNRRDAASLIDDTLIMPPLRMKHCSELARKTFGLIEHDRFLLRVGSRHQRGKGNM